MATLVLGDPPPELQALIERRRRAGLDRFDEVWAGVLHMVPAPTESHARIESQLHRLVGPVADAAHLVMSGQFNLGESVEDFRVPDAALHRSGGWGTWAHTAALVIEIVSPGDETWEKLPFYAKRDVSEVLIVDPTDRTVAWLVLREGEYQPVEQSALIDLGPAALSEQIDWP
jgi:Uma2 family endonuclease